MVPKCEIVGFVAERNRGGAALCPGVAGSAFSRFSVIRRFLERVCGSWIFHLRFSGGMEYCGWFDVLVDNRIADA
jgi:hypothetical protein